MGSYNKIIKSINETFNTSENMFQYPNFIRVSLNKNNVFNRYLVTKVKDRKVDIPLIAISQICNYIKHIFNNKEDVNNSSIIIPLYVNTYSKDVSTFKFLLSNAFNSTTFNERLTELCTRKGDIYYGGKGIILDKNYNLLLLCTVRVDIPVNNINNLSYISPIIYIDSRVFSNKSFVNNGIVRYIVPYIRNIKIDYSNILQKEAVIIIDDINKFISTPTIPTSQENINESLNNCLIDNFEDISRKICH